MNAQPKKPLLRIRDPRARLVPDVVLRAECHPETVIRIPLTKKA
jgi:hypothetical protein